jgi:hypothetical protein
MNPTKLTQKRAVFYLLWKSHQKNPDEFVPTWRALGELEIPELNTAFFMSYKTPTNGFELYFENPNLVERSWQEGKSGAHYYIYKLRTPFIETNIIEPSLKAFYCALVGKNPDEKLSEIPEGKVVSSEPQQNTLQL